MTFRRIIADAVIGVAFLGVCVVSFALLIVMVAS